MGASFIGDVDYGGEIFGKYQLVTDIPG
jgi:hypothetical protein